MSIPYQRIRRMPMVYIELAGKRLAEGSFKWRNFSIYLPLFFGILYLISDFRWFGACLTLIAVAHLAILASHKRKVYE